jgi:rhodanese-related sulfurtransferase
LKPSENSFASTSTASSLPRPVRPRNGREQRLWGTFPRASFADHADVRHYRSVTALDVRRNLEWTDKHVDGAVHVPLHDLLHRLDEVPPGEVWVHWKSGYRASIATSVLAAAGRRVVAIDDEFDRAERLARSGGPTRPDGSR